MTTCSARRFGFASALAISSFSGLAWAAPQPDAEPVANPALTIERILVDASAEPAVRLPLDHAQIRARYIELDGAALAIMGSAENARSAVVSLELFDDVVIEAVTDRLSVTGDDMDWRGRIDGGYALLTRRGGETAGMIRSARGTFEIIPQGNGVSRVAEVHLDALPGCGVDDFNIPGNPVINDAIIDAVERTIAAEEAEGAESASARGVTPSLDQLVAYTPNALSSVGGSTAGMDAFIENAIADFNTVLENSNIAMSTRAVIKVALTENETGDGAGDRNAFRINGDGKWDEIHALRDQFGADVGHLLVRDSNVCGIAAQIWRGSANGDDFAFCLTDTSCVSNLTFIHEVGHVIGCAHDLDNSGGAPGTFSYSFGWHDPDASPSWHTIMSYSPAAGSSRVPYFSTPDVIWTDGNPLGSSVSADNSRTINLNVSAITGWRATADVPPTGLIADPNPGQINLTWDNVTIASGYQVWRGATDNPLASGLRGGTGAGVTTFTDSSVTAGQTYFYFVKALFPDGGSSAFSDAVEAVAQAGMAADLSGDGAVNGVDLAILLAAWGSANADLSGDGTTNGVDLAILLAAWG